MFCVVRTAAVLNFTIIIINENGEIAFTCTPLKANKSVHFESPLNQMAFPARKGLLVDAERLELPTPAV
jgi:hypothetical protein